MNKNIRFGIFPLISGYMQLFFIVFFFLMMVLVPSASACTLTCYVDDDGTGDYNVDHSYDEAEINAAIDNVALYATAGNPGTVILNYTATGYSIYNSINMNHNYVSLIGENQGVRFEVAKSSPIVYSSVIFDAYYLKLKNITIDGNYLENGWPGGAGLRRELYLKENRLVDGVHDIIIENIIGMSTSDDLIYGQGYNITIKNIQCSNVRHSCIFGTYAKYQTYGGITAVANWTVTDIYCTNLGNACFRTLSMNGVYVKNLTSVWTSGYTEFAIEIWSGDTGSYINQNHYYENITSIGDDIQAIIIQSDPSLNTYFRNRNFTFKNVMIDCVETSYNPSCRANSAGTYDGGSNDRPGAVRIQGATDVVIDGFTILNASIGIRFANYVNLPANITIKNSILTNNTVAIAQIRGNTNHNWNINYNDLWNNGAITSGYVTLDSANIYSDPYLAMSGSFSNINKYRLKSQYGRWTGTAWTNDAVMSPAIDAGDPASDYSKEPAGNGNRINLGAYGNTIYSSKSASGNYGISGYVHDNNGDLLSGVVVTDGANSSDTDNYGLYNVRGLYNGTYNFSYSKAGFNTGYFEVTITGASISKANMTIYDTTAPSVTGLTATKTNSTAVTLSYDATGSWYKIYRDGELKATTRGNSWIDTNVSVDNTYQYNVSANDTYGNQGSNSSVKITIYPHTVANLTPLIDTAIKSGQPNMSRGSSIWIDLGKLAGNTNGNYRGLLYFDVSTIPSSAKINSALLTMAWEGGNRNQTTVISVYRPFSSWDAYASWNNRQNSVSWKTPGGDWIDKNGVSYGSSPYAEVTYPVGSTTDANINVTSIVQEYVNGKYPNTGLFLKANEIENTYISFHSSEASNTGQRPKLTINYTNAGENPSNPAPSITSLSPPSLTPQYPINTSASFNVTVDQQVTNKWLVDNILQSEISQSYTKIWSFADAGDHNITYSGENANGTVTTTWIVTVQHGITVPSAPQNLVAIPGNNRVDLSWQIPSSDGDAPITNYKIYRNGYLAATLGNILTYTDNNLTSGMEYSYQVSAINSAGEGAKSNQFNAIPSLNTVVNLTVINDTSIKSGQPNSTRGSSTWIDLGRLSGSTYGSYRGILYFDVSTIPSSAKINSAILTLTWEGANRNQSTVISVHRPSSTWDAQYASWNNSQSNVSWTTHGGDWIDKNGVAYGPSPYAEVTYPVGSTTDAILNVTSIIQEYVNGNYPNTGLFLKANEIENTYISFYSSEALNASQRPKLTIDYTTGDMPSYPAPSINTFSPSSLIPQYPINTSSSFTVTIDQSVSNTWYSDGIKQDTSTQTWINNWSLSGQHNVTYVGSNSNGSVSVTWNVSVISTSLYDVNLDGSVDIADLKVIKEHLSEVTSVPYPRYDVNADGKVDILDLTLVSINFK